uniref:MYB-CC type transcription factor LHEQLE-containing domain-containing protein n=1 Tax=Salix viminalis TaxID=40686 RepID=A0A6N2KIJ2_SALVM
MHHHHQHQGNNFHSSSRNSIPSENHLFLQVGNGPGDSGLILSTDAKPRLKWTADLHERFIEAVNQLGGAENTILKFRSLHFSEALQVQIEVQRRLHEQIEVQRHLQLRIEAQGKYLQSVLEKAQETLGRQNLGTAGLETAKVQLSELVSKVSNQCLNSAFSELNDLQGLCPQQTQPTRRPNDCSMDSCLTSIEGSQKEQETHNNGMGMRPYNSNPLAGEHGLQQAELKWGENVRDNKMFLSSLRNDTERRRFSPERRCSDLSTSVGGGLMKGRSEYGSFQDKTNKRVPYFATSKLDLNSHGEIDAASGCGQLDLNGSSWN